jgi:hypothetical protein
MINTFGTRKISSIMVALWGEDIEKSLQLLNPQKIDSIRKLIGLPSYRYLVWRNKKKWSE